MKAVVPRVLLLIACFGSCRGFGGSKPEPLATIDLRAYGYTIQAPNSQYLQFLHDASGLEFVNDHTLLAYFLEINASPVLERRGENKRFQLHLILLDSDTGKQQASTVVPASLTVTQVFVSAGGHVIVNTGNALRSFSSSLQPIAENVLQGGEWLATMSPTGRTLFLAHAVSTLQIGGEIEIYGRDADSFVSVGEWTLPAGNNLYSLDKFLLERDSNQYGPAKFLALASNLATDAIINAPSAGTWQTTAMGSDSVLFASDRGVYLAGIGTDPVMIAGAPKGYGLAGRLAICRNQEFVAVPWESFTFGPIGLPAKITGLRADVYDVQTRHTVRTIDIKPRSAQPAFRLAISPIGKRLAVMNDYEVAIYAIE